MRTVNTPITRPPFSIISVYAELEALHATGLESSELLIVATGNGTPAMGPDDIVVLCTDKVADRIQPWLVRLVAGA